MGNTSANLTPPNPYQGDINNLKRQIDDLNGDVYRLNTDIGQIHSNINNDGTNPDGIHLAPKLLVSENRYPNGNPLNDPDGLNKQIGDVQGDIDSNYQYYIKKYNEYNTLQKTLFGNSKHSGDGLVDTVTDISGQIIRNKIENAYTKKTEITGFDFKYETIKNQNVLLESQSQDNQDKYSIDPSKQYYQGQRIINIKAFNIILLTIYVFLFIMLIFVLFLSNFRFSMFQKIFILCIFILYPLFISLFTKLLSFFWDKYIHH